MMTYLSPLASVGAQQAEPLLPAWALVVLFILLVVLFVWLILRWSAKKPADIRQAEEDLPVRRVKAPEIPQTALETPAVPQTVMEVPAPAPVVVLDDLVIIEGIGPKIAGVLKQAGITSFAQLAETPSERITEILHAGGIRLADPSTWPEQARLAAAGDQAALKALQDRLKGGREGV